jgi:hypothetical protein
MENKNFILNSNMENLKETILEKLLFSQKDQKKIILILILMILGMNFILTRVVEKFFKNIPII